MGDVASLLCDRARPAALIDPELLAGLEGELGGLLPVVVLLYPAGGPAVGFGAERRGLAGDVMGEAVGADRLRALLPDLAVGGMLGAGAEHVDDGVALDADGHGLLGLLEGGLFEGVLVDREALADAGMLAVPFGGAARLLARVISGVALSDGALLVMLRLLLEDARSLLGGGAALAAARQPAHLVDLAFGVAGALVSGVGVMVGLLGAALGVLSGAGVMVGVAAQQVAELVAF